MNLQQITAGLLLVAVLWNMIAAFMGMPFDLSWNTLAVGCMAQTARIEARDGPVDSLWDVNYDDSDDDREHA